MNDVLAGTWKPNNLWGGFKDGMIKLAPMNPVIPKDVQATVTDLEGKMKAGTFHPFTGPIVDQDDYYVYLLEPDQTSFTVIYSNLEHSYYDTQRLGSIGYHYTIHSRIDHQPVIVYIFRDPTKTAVFGTGSGKEGYLEVSLSAIFYYEDGKRVHFSEEKPALLSIAELRSNLDPHLPDIGRYEYVSEFSGAIIPVTGSTIQR